MSFRNANSLLVYSDYLQHVFKMFAFSMCAFFESCTPLINGRINCTLFSAVPNVYFHNFWNLIVKKLWKLVSTFADVIVKIKVIYVLRQGVVHKNTRLPIHIANMDTWLKYKSIHVLNKSCLIRPIYLLTHRAPEYLYKFLLLEQLEKTPVHVLSWQRSCHVCRDV